MGYVTARTEVTQKPADAGLVVLKTTYKVQGVPLGPHKQNQTKFLSVT